MPASFALRELASERGRAGERDVPALLWLSFSSPHVLRCSLVVSVSSVSLEYTGLVQQGAGSQSRYHSVHPYSVLVPEHWVFNHILGVRHTEDAAVNPNEFTKNAYERFPTRFI